MGIPILVRHLYIETAPGCCMMWITGHRIPSIKHLEADSWVVDYSYMKHPDIRANNITTTVHQAEQHDLASHNDTSFIEKSLKLIKIHGEVWSIEAVWTLSIYMNFCKCLFHTISDLVQFLSATPSTCHLFLAPVRWLISCKLAWW